jgi:hypothetical protein
MLRKQHGRTVALLFALVALLGGVQGCADALAPQTADPEVAPSATPADAPAAERNLTLPSGATLKVAADWMVTESKDGLTLEDPEKQFKVELVEVDASAGMNAAVSAAWASRNPAFKRQELASSDSPGREGWGPVPLVRIQDLP